MSWKECQIRNEKLKKLEKETRHKYGAGAYYDSHKERIIKYSVNSKYHKKKSHKTLRRKLKEEKVLIKGNIYNKYYDYWWCVI